MNRFNAEDDLREYINGNKNTYTYILIELGKLRELSTHIGESGSSQFLTYLIDKLLIQLGRNLEGF